MMMNDVRKMVGIVVGVLIALIVVVVAGGSFYTVDQGQRGVILRTGKVVDTAAPGLGFKLPLVDNVVTMSVQTQARVWKDVMAYSKDQQTATMALSVNYRIPADQVTLVYSDWGGEDGIVSRLLDRQVPEELKNVFGRFNAATAIQERERLSAEVQMAIQNAVKGLPLIVESVQLENIDFSDAYEQSIEQRMLAEVEVQKVQQNAEREKVQAEIKVIQAQAEADSRLAQAKAEAEAIKLKGEAEAQAIRQRGQALAQNPNLVNLVTAERWNGELPSTMLPGGSVPFVDVNRK
jgi:regulator of protease activity HflC (stomatin/prohibitin superfamily)